MASTDKYLLEVLHGWRLSKQGVAIPIRLTKARALLSILALNDVSVLSRQVLADLLWEGVPSGKARASLRQLIHTLKQDLGQQKVVQQTRDEISFDASQFDTDIDALFADLGRGNCTTAKLRDVKRLADILATLDDLGADFSDWVQDVRRRLQDQAVGYLRAYVTDETQSLASRNLGAQTLHDIDPYDEDAVRTLMDTHHKMNNSVVALRIYDSFFARLEQELDAEPSILTQDLAVTIKLGQESHPPAKVAHLEEVGIGEPTVAVLPFEVAGQDLPDHVVIGLLDHLTCQLAVLRAPAVISSNSTRRFLGKQPELNEIRTLLKATYVVSGVLRSDGRQAVISVQVSKTSDNKVVWANRHRCALEELYAIDLPIVSEIVQAVSLPIHSAELKRSISTPTENLEPYHLFLQAKTHIFKLNAKDFATGGDLLYQAIKLDPEFAPAHALLAEWFALAIWQGFSQTPEADKVSLEYHLQRATQLSPGDGRVLALWAHSQLILHRRYEQAGIAFKKALDLGPNDAETLIWSVPNFAFTGQTETAIRNGEKALRLSPIDPFAFRNEHFLSLAHYAAGNFARAADLGLSSYRRAPNYAANLRVTIAALSALNRESEATALVAMHKRAEPDFTHDGFFQKSAWQSVNVRKQLRTHLLRAGLS